MKDDTIGVDISKDKLDVYRLSDDRFVQFPNSVPGYRRLRQWFGNVVPARVIYEPTGV